jgi:hypothetical protein
MKKSTIHSGVGITPTAPWMRSLRASSRADRSSSHFPYAASSLRRRVGLAALERVEEPHGPGVEVFAERAGFHAIPLHADDRSCVADELTREVGRDGRRKQLRRLDLLRDDEGLGLGTGSSRVVAREGEEHDEAEQHGEPGRQHAEHAGSAVTVVEVAAIGCGPPHPEHRPDRDPRGCHDDEDRQRQTHTRL